MQTLIDLSHTISDGLVTYKGLPAPLICDFLSREASQQFYAEGTSFQIGRIDMCVNTGTYLDAPFHRYENGEDIAQLELEALADLDGIKITVPENVTEIGSEYCSGRDVSGKAVLVQTNWSRHWNSERYYEGHPYLTADAARCLQEGGAALVGIDSYNIDDINDGTRPAHSILLGAGILIVEHMCNLQQLPGGGFRFYAVPVKVEGVGTFPVRAFARLPT